MPKAEELPRGVFERPRGSGVYWIRYADSARRMRREKIGPKLQLAIDAYHKRKIEVREQRFFPERPRSALFEELTRDFLELSRIRHSRKHYEHNLNFVEFLLGHFRGRAADQVTAQEIMRVLGAPEDWAPATRNRYRAAISGIYSLAFRNDKISVNPAKKVRLWRENNARVRFLEPKEEKTLRSAIASSIHLAELDLALATGMRRGEQYRLRWTSVDWTRKILTVENSKNGERRHIPINETALAALRVLRRGRAAAVYVVPGPSAEADRAEDNRRWFDAAMKRAGLRNFHWHDLRHTFASRLVMAGHDIRTVQDLMGHKTIGMTVRYSHLSAPHKRDAVKSLEAAKTSDSSTSSEEQNQEAAAAPEETGASS